MMSLMKIEFNQLKFSKKHDQHISRLPSSPETFFSIDWRKHKWWKLTVVSHIVFAPMVGQSSSIGRSINWSLQTEKMLKQIRCGMLLIQVNTLHLFNKFSKRNWIRAKKDRNCFIRRIIFQLCIVLKLKNTLIKLY